MINTKISELSLSEAMLVFGGTTFKCQLVSKTDGKVIEYEGEKAEVEITEHRTGGLKEVLDELHPALQHLYPFLDANNIKIQCPGYPQKLEL